MSEAPCIGAVVVWEAIIRATSDGVVVIDEHGLIASVNPAAARMFGYEPDEIVGGNVSVLMPEPHRSEHDGYLARYLETGEGNVIGNCTRLFAQRKDGEIFPVELTVTDVVCGDRRVFAGIIRDVTEKTRREEEMTRHVEGLEFAFQAFERQAEHMAKIAEQIDDERRRAEYLSNHDALTGLPNRVLFWDRLEQAFFQAKREHTGVAVLYLDLNKFKDVNDTLGHDRGDALLKEVAAKLLHLIRETDTAARLGGDEFAVIARVPDPDDLGGLTILAERIRSALTIPVEFPEGTILTGASIGVAVYPHCCDGVDAIVKGADSAMFEGKREGGQRIVFYRPPHQSLPAS
ncbi:MAG: diguanylate cyclase [Alphaproteobacteria bacterium]|nr:diguanylate cyclase [Alphaproteobacteria bacterium]MBF0130784.1 diguanylate cyclase [Alphaproteobacteria bacterium]